MAKSWKYFPLVWLGMKDEQGVAGVLKWPFKNSGVRQKSSLQRFASCLPKYGEEACSSSSSSSYLPPDTDCGESIFFTVYDTHNGGRQARGYRASGGFGVKKGWDWAALGSDHGTIWSLHLEELNDEGGASRDNLGWQVAERTVLDAHDGQLAAEGQLKWEAVQVGVVVEV